MTINKDKFVFASTYVHFCGFDIDKEGIQADPAMIKAIAEFPTSESLTELRSFFGLVNHLADFTLNISSAAETLRHWICFTSMALAMLYFNNMVKNDDSFNAVEFF